MSDIRERFKTAVADAMYEHGYIVFADDARSEYTQKKDWKAMEVALHAAFDTALNSIAEVVEAGKTTDLVTDDPERTDAHNNAKDEDAHFIRAQTK